VYGKRKSLLSAKSLLIAIENGWDYDKCIFDVGWNSMQAA
jgi:hypothetical protein